MTVTDEFGQSHQVLRKNMYDLESGEPSVFDGGKHACGGGGGGGDAGMAGSAQQGEAQKAGCRELTRAGTHLNYTTPQHTTEHHTIQHNA